MSCKLLSLFEDVKVFLTLIDTYNSSKLTVNDICEIEDLARELNIPLSINLKTSFDMVDYGEELLYKSSFDERDEIYTKWFNEANDLYLKLKKQIENKICK